jgi:hypothetical protein
MALLPGSPAIDAGDNTACAGSPVSDKDQRGAARPIGVACDIGAYEAGSVALSGLSPASGPTSGGTTVTIRGGGFGGTTSVSFGGAAATTVSVSATTITVTTPAHGPGAVDVAVTSGGQTRTLTGAYTYGALAPLPPQKPNPPAGGPPPPNPLPAARPGVPGDPNTPPNPLPSSR